MTAVLKKNVNIDPEVFLDMLRGEAAEFLLHSRKFQDKVTGENPRGYRLDVTASGSIVGVSHGSYTDTSVVNQLIRRGEAARKVWEQECRSARRVTSDKARMALQTIKYANNPGVSHAELRSLLLAGDEKATRYAVARGLLGDTDMPAGYAFDNTLPAKLEKLDMNPRLVLD